VRQSCALVGLSQQPQMVCVLTVHRSLPVPAALQHCDSRAARPGSGKSTFCQSLMQRSMLMWERVNQDTIADGRCGARKLPVHGLLHSGRQVHSQVFTSASWLVRLYAYSGGAWPSCLRLTCSSHIYAAEI